MSSSISFFCNLAPKSNFFFCPEINRADKEIDSLMKNNMS